MSFAVIVSNVVDLFVQLCDVKNMLTYTSSSDNKHTDSLINSTKLDAYENFVHDSIALKICNEILSNTNDASYVKLLSRALNQLTICPRNVTALNDLADLAVQIVDALGENRAAKKLVEKFQMRLQVTVIPLLLFFRRIIFDHLLTAPIVRYH